MSIRQFVDWSIGGAGVGQGRSIEVLIKRDTQLRKPRPRPLSARTFQRVIVPTSPIPDPRSPVSGPGDPRATSLHDLRGPLRRNLNLKFAVILAIERHLRDPTRTSKSRIKKLRGISRPQYRLRVDEIRVFYDVAEGVVEVLATVHKSEAESWLKKVGEPDERNRSL